MNLRLKGKEPKISLYVHKKPKIGNISKRKGKKSEKTNAFSPFCSEEKKNFQDSTNDFAVGREEKK